MAIKSTTELDSSAAGRGAYRLMDACAARSASITAGLMSREATFAYPVNTYGAANAPDRPAATIAMRNQPGRGKEFQRSMVVSVRRSKPARCCE